MQSQQKAPEGSRLRIRRAPRARSAVDHFVKFSAAGEAGSPFEQSPSVKRFRLRNRSGARIH